MRIATLFGVPVLLHWTMGVLLLVLGVSYGSQPETLLAILGMIGVIAFVIVAHEFGHVLAARAWGIPAQDVTLTPLGGIARLTDLPRTPRAEVQIALAGPAVNLALAVIATPFMLLDPATTVDPWLVGSWSVAQSFVFLNLMLGGFNLLPAFPMDGGRVLRALLWTRSGHLVATEIAVGVGRVLAVGMVLIGLLWNPWLILIAVFVWLIGGQELQQAQLLDESRRAEAEGIPVLPPHVRAMLRLMGIDPQEFLKRMVAQGRGATASPERGFAQSGRTAAPSPFGPASPFGPLFDAWRTGQGVSASSRETGQATSTERAAYHWPGTRSAQTFDSNVSPRGRADGSAGPSTGNRVIEIEIVDARPNRPGTPEQPGDYVHTRDGRHFYKGQEIL